MENKNGSPLEQSRSEGSSAPLASRSLAWKELSRTGWRHWQVSRNGVPIGDFIAEELRMEGDTLCSVREGRVIGSVAGGPGLSWKELPLPILRETAQEIIARTEPDPLSDLDHILTDLHIWMRRTLERTEYRGQSDNSGHPHGYTVCLCPDWELRQKIENLRMAKEIVARLCVGSEVKS